MNAQAEFSPYHPSWDPHAMTKEEYTGILGDLAKKQPNEVFMLDSNSLKRVGKVMQAWQTIKGWLGFENKTDPVKVNYELLKLLRHGQIHHFIEQDEVKTLVRQLKETLAKTQDYKIAATAIDTLLTTPNPTPQINRQIISYHKEHAGDLHQAYWPQKFHKQIAPQQLETATVRFNLGCIYAQEGNYVQAITELANAVDLNPANQQWKQELKHAKVQRAKELEKEGKTEDAYTLLADVYGKHPQPAEVKILYELALKIGKKALQSNNSALGLTYLEKAWTHDVNDKEIPLLLVSIYSKMKNWQNAALWNDRLVDLSPNDWEVRIEAANIAQACKSPKDALEQTKKALELAPDSKKADIAALVIAAAERLPSTEHESLNEAYRLALPLITSKVIDKEHVAKIHTTLASAFPQDAIMHLEKAHQLLPNDEPIRQKLADLYKAAGNTKELGSILLAAKTPQAYADLAKIQLQKNEFASALANFQKAQTSPELKNAFRQEVLQCYISLANAALAANSLQEAILHLVEARKIAPDDSQLFELLARCYKESGNNTDYTNLLLSTKEPKAYAEVAKIHLQRKNYKAALEYFQKAQSSKEFENHFQQELYQCLVALADQEEPQKAQGLLAQALPLATKQQKPELTERLLVIGEKLFQNHLIKGEYGRALLAFTSFKEEFPIVPLRIPPDVYVRVATDPDQKKLFSDDVLFRGLLEAADIYEKNGDEQAMVTTTGLALNVAPKAKIKELAYNLLSFAAKVTIEKPQLALTTYEAVLPHLHKIGLDKIAIARVYVDAAEMAKETGNNSKAIKNYKQALSYDKLNPAINASLAALFKQQKNIDEAIKHYEAAYNANTANALIKEALCELRIAKGDELFAAEATDYLHENLKEFVTFTKTIPEIRNSLGTTLGSWSMQNQELSGLGSSIKSLNDLKQQCNKALELVSIAYDGKKNHQPKESMPRQLKVLCDKLFSRISETTQLLDGILDGDTPISSKEVDIQKVRAQCAEQYNKAAMLNAYLNHAFLQRLRDLNTRSGLTDAYGMNPNLQNIPTPSAPKMDTHDFTQLMDRFILPDQEQQLLSVLTDQIAPMILEDESYTSASAHGYFLLANHYLKRAHLVGADKQDMISRAYQFFKNAMHYDKDDAYIAEPDCYGKFAELHEFAYDNHLMLPGDPNEWNTNIPDHEKRYRLSAAQMYYARAVGYDKSSKYQKKSDDLFNAGFG